MSAVPELVCGRKLHAAPQGVDERPVCLMHSKDPDKQSGSLFDAFRIEFERILQEAGSGEAHFEFFVFPGLDFSQTTFHAACQFHQAVFTQEVNFYMASFAQDAIFVQATFTQDANFFLATFARRAHFGGATFTQSANFPEVTFMMAATFFRTTFAQDANFAATTFDRAASFSRATFTRLATFTGTKFHETASWEQSRFLERAEFVQTKFAPRLPGQPSAVFDRAIFSKPGDIVFDDVDLSRVLLSGTDVSQVWFSSSVKWATREGSRGVAVFQETRPVSPNAAAPPGDQPRDYRAIAQTYQQLKKNYDARLDYWTADEFHFGEMEMKRLAGPAEGIPRWLHRRLSLVALYRYASDYGNNYQKAMVWLFGILILFALLLPLPGLGLQRQGAATAESYSSVWSAGGSVSTNLRSEVRLLGKSAITSVDAATFEKAAEYTPAYPWGRVLSIAVSLLTSILFALFLLAIRRQFRR